MKRSSLFAIVALMLSLAARQARADAVPPAPKDCPSGTHGVTGHAGPGCVPDKCPPGAYGDMCEGGPCCVASQCGGDAGRACSATSKCEEVKACTRPRTTIGWAASRLPVKEELAVCNGSGACPGGGTCETLMVCVAGPTAPAAPAPTGPSAKPKGTSGCAVTARDAPGSVAAGIVLAAAAVLMRRRR